LRNAGGGIVLQLAREQTRTAFALRAGASGGRLGGTVEGSRAALVAEARGRATFSAGDRFVSLLTGGNVTAGETSGATWTRTIGTVDRRAGRSPSGRRAAAAC